MDFDYKRAWEELASPAFDALPQNIRDLYYIVAEHGMSQLPDLDCAWPDDSLTDMRARFGDLAEKEALLLSSSARTIHAYGHWMSEKNPHPGAYWKFSNYADQFLRVRFGIPRSLRSNGFGMYISDGELRLSYSDHWNWTWEAIGLVSAATVDATRQAIAELGPVRLSPRDPCSEANLVTFAAMSKNLIAAHGSGLWDLSTYMVPYRSTWEE